MPGPLKDFVRQVKLNSGASCQRNSECALAIMNLPGCEIRCPCSRYWLTSENIPNLYMFLTSNNYIINTNLTEMVIKTGITQYARQLICMFSYNP